MTKTEQNENITQDISAHTDDTKDNILRQQSRPSSVHVTELSNVTEFEDVNGNGNNTLLSHDTVDQGINVQDVQSLFTHTQDALVDASKEEVATLCDVMAAYSTVCGEQDVSLALPSVCG